MAGNTAVYRLSAERFDEFRSRLTRLGFAFEARQHQAFFARYEAFTVSAYTSGKVVVAGKDALLHKELRFVLSRLGATELP